MTCDKDPDKIKNMFDEISDYYDEMNNLISFGTHYIIKYLALKSLKIEPHSDVLDLCCGTGDFSRIISKLTPTSNVIGLDFSDKMIQIAKHKNPKGIFIQGDCTSLPFKDEEFDFITIGFGLRNIQDRKKALSEIYRTLKKEGKFLHLDFGQRNKISNLFNILVPPIVKITGKDAKHYEYLLSSKNEYPNPIDLILEFQQCKLKYLKKYDYLFNTISAQIMQK